MQVALRRLIIVGAISLSGAVAGVALGNFAAGGGKPSGLDQLAAYSAMLNAQAPTAGRAIDDDPGFAPRPGPSSYSCQGCDAHLYNDMMPGAPPADTAPLPPYRAEPEMPVRAPASAAVLRETPRADPASAAEASKAVGAGTMGTAGTTAPPLPAQ